ncbi:MAG: CDP-alcohol phosphatidyltransferase family protein [Candidatus Hodarchaeales archaeon]|jgi:archaetidylinositol phosphate synthase
MRLEKSLPKKKLRSRYEAFFAPFGRFLAKTGVSPNTISVMSLIASIFSCIAYASGPTVGESFGLLLGTFLLGCSSLLDMLDGSLARAKGIAGHFGALLDRTLDRVSEFFFLLGIMAGGYVYSEWVFFCFEGMILASYVRSTAEKRGGLNMDSTTGMFERKEKLTVLAIGCLAEILIYENIIDWPFDFGILGLIVIIIGLFSNISAFQRLKFAREFYASSEEKKT